jgi:hypothetical protein
LRSDVVAAELAADRQGEAFPSLCGVDEEVDAKLVP